MLLLFVSIACANMLIPSYAAIQVEFSIPEALIAIPDAFFVVVSAFFALLWGYYTDRIDRTKVIMAGAFSSITFCRIFLGSAPLSIATSFILTTPNTLQNPRFVSNQTLGHAGTSFDTDSF